MELKTYFSSDYQGGESFVENIIKPIFGEDKFENRWCIDLLEDNPDLRNIAQSCGINSILWIGTIDIPLNPIEIFDITVDSNVIMARNRVGIQSLIRNIMNTYSGAFMIFHYEDCQEKWEWRFSFCNKGADAQEFTESKRFTYLMGRKRSCRTAAERFNELRKIKDRIDIKNIIQAFDVEALSKEFFNKYREYYADFVQYITGKRIEKIAGKWKEVVKQEPHEIYHSQFDGNDKAVRDYIKKMMGRIVFLHFLQAKGWMAGDHEYLLNLFEKSQFKEDFLERVLEPLFFGLLNTKPDDRTQLFTINRWDMSLIPNADNIPYLNGGLFESNEEDKKTVAFPADMFSRLLSFFSQYNFTIDENDPNDAEVGVDPEMLGKIFESLLEDNKDKGAFYTPKEIVQYMCKESLIVYLETKLPESAHIFRTFVESYQFPTDFERKDMLLSALKCVKICDPAIGSGAFPMSLLNELVRCRLTLEPTINLCELKKEIICNNIYGVDIEKGAIDIARLRFWLSILVDSEQPEPLPNFDYKFMQGNALLESYKGVDLSQLTIKKQSTVGSVQLSWMDDITDVSRHLLHDLILKYYSCTDHKEKELLKERITNNIKDQIKEGGYNIDVSDIDLAANSYFFLWRTWFADVFSQNGGFDIVIGNPPYIQLENNQGELSKLYKPCGYEFLAKQGKGDIYCLFYEQGINLLRSKGILCYITSNKWMRAGYGEAIRSLLALKTNPKLLIDFAGVQIFESATVDTNILLLENTINQGKTICVSLGKASKECVKNMSVFVQQAHTICEFTNSNSWVVLSPIEQRIKKKIEAVGTPLKDWDINIYRGVLTGCNEAFIISGSKRQEILDNCKDDDERNRTAELIRPILRGRDIKRYGYEWADLWLLYIPWHFPLQFDLSITGASDRAEKIFQKEYPTVYNHLLQYKPQLSARNKAETGIRYEWYAMQRWGANYWEDFLKPKIIYPNMTKYLPFVLDENCFLTNQKCFIITGEKIAYLSAFLNSSLFKFCFRDRFPELLGGTRELSKIFFEKLPILRVDDGINEEFKRIVLDIQNEYTKAKAIAIDAMIFDLYKLTYQERSAIGYIEIL